jgi:hypothetical protein
MLTAKEDERQQYLDPRDFYANELQNWQSLWDNDSSLYQNVYGLLSQSVFLPNKDLLMPLATIYLLMPCKWSKVAPIMFCWGDKGSGKSTIASLANYIHGLKQTFSPTDTFASVRNALDSMRWVSTEDKEFEKEGALLAWDNIHISTLERDPKLYQLLLFGYNRSTDRIRIAGSQGKNLDYHVYCPKIISSIEPIHLVPEFNELQRRLIVIPHKPFEKFNSEEKKGYEGIDIKIDRLDLDSISWDGIEKEFLSFWNIPEYCQSYVAWRGLLTRKGKKSFKIPSIISGENWTISIDIIATGLTLGVWGSVQSAIDYLGDYWEFVKLKIFNESSATLAHLENFINEEVGIMLVLNERIIDSGGAPHHIFISPQKLKDRLTWLQNTGQLDITPRQKDINFLMWQLGWKLSTKGWMQR